MFANWKQVFWSIGIILAVLTVAEYFLAINLDNNIAVLTVAALAKAVLIVWYFMHLPRIWRRERGH